MPEIEPIKHESTADVRSLDDWLSIAAEADPELAAEELADIENAGIGHGADTEDSSAPRPVPEVGIGTDSESNQPGAVEQPAPAHTDLPASHGGAHVDHGEAMRPAPTNPPSQWRSAVPPREDRPSGSPGSRFDNFEPQQTHFPPSVGPRPGWAAPAAPQPPAAPVPPLNGAGPQQAWGGPPSANPGYNNTPAPAPQTFGMWQQPQPGTGYPGAASPGMPSTGQQGSPGAPTPPPAAEFGRPDPAQAGYVSMETADSLADKYSQQKYATAKKPEPQRGWRKGVLKGTFGVINPGESGPEKEDRLLREKINANIRGQFVFAVLSLKGGMANSTTTAGIGSIFAETRGAEVIALDINPDSGNLAWRINPEAKHTFVDVLRDDAIQGRTDVRSYTKHNAVKLDVLASSEQLVNPPTYTPETLRATVDKLRRAYTVIGLDCGKSINSALVPAVLDMVNAIVVVTSVTSDGFRGALILHDWLRAHGRSQLLERSFLLMSDQDSKKNPKMKKGIEDDVAKIIWKDPAYIPYDPHIHEGAVINLDQLAEPTYRALLKATGRLAEWYNMPPLPMATGLHA
ncbi:ESX-1 secretion-associated protein EspI [Mycobacteroides abscessus subsp. massiliense]|nr:ESX-1 secretion-associated protein EspI [Mycobacteroides abscessus subsp. massiliense]